MRTRFAATIAVATLAAGAVCCEGPDRAGRWSPGHRQRRQRAPHQRADGSAGARLRRRRTGGVVGHRVRRASPHIASSRRDRIGCRRRPAPPARTLVDFTRDLTPSGSFSMIPAPGLSQFGALFIPDDPTPASGPGEDPGHPRRRGSGADLDLRDLADRRPLVRDASRSPRSSFGAASPYVTVPPGNYRIRVTPAGNPSTILLDSGNVTLGSRDRFGRCS